MNRRTARELTFGLIFEYSFNTDLNPDDLYELYLNCYPDHETGVLSSQIKSDNYISKTYKGVIEKLAEIDPLIRSASANWDFNRISKVAQSILRLAVYEIMFIDDIPPKVSVNEAIELAKKYGEDDSYVFINGILGNILQNNLKNGKE